MKDMFIMYAYYAYEVLVHIVKLSRGNVNLTLIKKKHLCIIFICNDFLLLGLGSSQHASNN